VKGFYQLPGTLFRSITLHTTSDGVEKQSLSSRSLYFVPRHFAGIKTNSSSIKTNVSFQSYPKVVAGQRHAKQIEPRNGKRTQSLYDDNLHDWDFENNFLSFKK
jgi:hypothetical protein